MTKHTAYPTKLVLYIVLVFFKANTAIMEGTKMSAENLRLLAERCSTLVKFNLSL